MIKWSFKYSIDQSQTKKYPWKKRIPNQREKKTILYRGYTM